MTLSIEVKHWTCTSCGYVHGHAAALTERPCPACLERRHDDTRLERDELRVKVWKLERALARSRKARRS